MSGNNCPRQYVERKNNFPFVYIHGLGGWGEQELISKIAPYWGIKPSRNILPMARHLGFEVYMPSIGAWIGNWDRACNLWAMLVGGRVDYGKVHSEKYGHDRYGRTYETGLIPDWGTLDAEGKRKKVNLIGHSLGCATLRLFMEFLEEGSAEEREGTPENELSELFKGGKTDWVHTATTLAPAYGGSFATAFVQNKKLINTTIKILGTAGAYLSDTPVEYFYDFRMEYLFGGEGYRESKKWKWKYTQAKKDAIKRYIENDIDNVGSELSAEFAPVLLKDCKTNPKTYYFSYTGNISEPEEDGIHYRAIKGVNPIFGKMATFEGHYTNPDLGITEDVGWFTGDGMVNTNQCVIPGEDSVPYTTTEDIKPGIWHVLPQEQKFHMSYMGLAEPAGAYFSFYYEIMRRACNLPVID